MIAHLYGLIQIGRKCNSILPVIVLSESSIGENSEGLKEIYKIISSMFSNFLDFLD